LDDQYDAALSCNSELQFDGTPNHLLSKKIEFLRVSTMGMQFA